MPSSSRPTTNNDSFLWRAPSLIGFAAWSSLAHAAVMVVQSFQNVIERGELLGVAALVIIGVVLIVLAPARQLVEQAAAAGA